jgi:hypothetical protein
MVEGSEGLVGLGKGILGDHGLNKVIEVTKEGVVEEARPVLPFRRGDDSAPGEAISMEDRSQSGMNSTRDP